MNKQGNHTPVDLKENAHSPWSTDRGSTLLTWFKTNTIWMVKSHRHPPVMLISKQLMVDSSADFATPCCRIQFFTLSWCRPLQSVKRQPAERQKSHNDQLRRSSGETKRSQNHSPALLGSKPTTVLSIKTWEIFLDVFDWIPEAEKYRLLF